MSDLMGLFSEEPPKEDSEDLTDDEVESAVDTSGPDDLAHQVCAALKESGGKFVVKGHELRRRGEHLFYRCRMVCAQEPDSVMVYQVDWLGR